MEIGSFYEIDEKTIFTEENKDFSLSQVTKFQKNNVVFTASGREAMSLSLKCLEIENNAIRKIVLMPAYMCDTVFIPFHNNGWQLYFYHMDRNMIIDKENLEAMVNTLNPGMIFIHDYYGVDSVAINQLQSYLKQLQKQGIMVMEDNTQSYYLHRDAKDFLADYEIGSLRKWYPIPDGGFVCSNHMLDKELLVEDAYYYQNRIAYMTSKWKYLYGEESNGERIIRKQEFLKENKQSEAYLDQFVKETKMSSVSQNICKQIDEEKYKQIREDNYEILYQGLSMFSSEEIRMVFPKVKRVAALYFPIYVKDRDEYQEYLRKNDIYAPVLWPIGKENEKILNKEEQYIFHHLLAMPMDARYGKEEMEKIIAVTKEYLGRVNS